MTKLPVRLKWYRENLKDKDSKWTQKYVADKIGVARVTYTAYENGTKMPPPDIINKIADLFNVSTDYLLGRTDKPNPLEENEFDPLAEIRKITDELGIEDLAFDDIEQWENFTKEDVEEIKRHFEYVSHKAKKRREKK